MHRIDGSTTSILQKVIEADIKRSCFSFSVHKHLSENKRTKKRQQLVELLTTVLLELEQVEGGVREAHHDDPTPHHYFQGFHDVCLLFWEVFRPRSSERHRVVVRKTAEGKELHRRKVVRAAKGNGSHRSDGSDASVLIRGFVKHSLLTRYLQRPFDAVLFPRDGSGLFDVMAEILCEEDPALFLKG
eukprot:g11330.t1